MANDFRIRLLGRPQVENDSAIGFQKLTRKYAVEGPKASKIGLDGSQDGIGLFREVGEPDEEFTDHYLVSQTITPGDTIDTAVLTRVYAQVRDTWYSEQASESGDLKKITRKYVVLKNSNSVLSQLGVSKNLGYGNREWSLHPTNYAEKNDNSDAWDRLPEIVRETEPVEVSYEDGDAVGTSQSPSTGGESTAERRVVFPRAVKVLSNANGQVDLQVTGASAWKLGKQEFVKTDGEALVDLDQSLNEGDEFTVLIDPRYSTDLDDPATFDPDDPYTDGVGSLVVGESVTLNQSSIKAVYPNVGSVNAQTDDGIIVEDFHADERVSSFVEDLAIYENTIPQTESEAENTTGNIRWVRASASMDTSNAGVDIWSVSWVAPVTAHWRTAGNSAKASGLPTVVAFDHHGLHTFKSSSTRKGGSVVFVYYTVQEQVPVSSSSYSKNSGSVSMDFKIMGLDGNHATASFKQSFANAAFYKTTRAHLEFPKYKDKGMNFPSNEKVVVACGSNCSHYDAGWVTNSNANIGRHLYFFYEADKELEEGEHPMFQGKPVQSFGGSITYDTTTWNSALMASPSSFRVTPIFSHNTVKIWKIEVTYF